MAKRKSINKRLSKYNRSSFGSGFLDPNSGILGEEEPFWWNNLTNNGSQSLPKNNATNQTSRFLDSDSHVDLSNATNEWWNILDSTDSENLDGLPLTHKNKQPVNTVPKTTKTSTSDSDEEDSLPPPQKRKITMRGASKRSKSNRFLKAFIDSETSKSSKSIQDTTLAKSTNTASISNTSLKTSGIIEGNKSKNDNIDVTTSTDQSHTTDKVLKSMPRVFRKRHKPKSDNLFENLLKSAENKHNETEAAQNVSRNSSEKLIERNEIPENNVSSKLQEHISQINSLPKDISKRSIANEISIDDGNRIYHKHSDSSFEIQSDHINEPSQKESFVKENIRSRTTHSPYSLKDNDRTRSEKINISTPRSKQKSNRSTDILNESLLNPQTDDVSRENFSKENNLTRPEEININASTSKQQSSRSTDSLYKSLTVSQTDNLNKEKFSKDNMIRSQEVNISVSTSKQRFSRHTDIVNRSLLTRQTNNLDKENLSKNNDITPPEEININASTSKQQSSRNTGSLYKSLTIPQTDDLNKEKFSKDNMIRSQEVNISVSTSKQRFSRHTDIVNRSLLTRQTNNLDKENLSKDNHITQPEEINVHASSSKQKSSRDAGILNETPIKFHTENLNNENFSKDNGTTAQGEININASMSKPKSKANKLIRKLEKIKEDGVIKKALEQKKKKINFNKLPTCTPLVGKEIRERIKELENNIKKQKITKPEIHRAYLINGKPYKRPRLPRPQPWVTDRLYRYLWKVMEPKCKSFTRVESEKFIKQLSKSVSVIIKSKKYDDYKDVLNALMNGMARLGIIHTRNDFYDFSHEFFPYNVRIKVIPMLMPGNVRNIPYDPKKLHESLIVK